MIKTNIKMRVTPKQSKKVQEICFNNNIYWSDKTIEKQKKANCFLCVGRDLFWGYIGEEVDADLFIRTNGTCIENPNEHLDRLDDIVDEVSKEDSHNTHYKAQKIDTIARCKANMTLEQQKAICIFNCDKYLHRSKGQDLEDIQKVRYYLNWLEEIEIQLKEENENI